MPIRMARFSYPLFFIILLPILSLTEGERSFNSRCHDFQCGNLGYIGYPFSNWTHPECGLMMVEDCNEPVQKIQLGKEGPWYNITNISNSNTITLEDQVFQNYLNNKSCESFKNLTLPSTPLLSFEITSKLTLFKCPNLEPKYTNFTIWCKDSFIYYNLAHTRGGENDLPTLPPRCSLIQLPMSNKTQNSTNVFNLLSGVFSLQVHVPPQCFECNRKDGLCQSDGKGKFYCSETRECYGCYRRGGNGTRRLKISLGIASGLLLLIAVLAIYFIRIRKRQKYTSRNLQSANTSSLTSSKSDLETRAVYFGVPIFSYSDLSDATNNFNHEKELGDGGFGTVYHGKLRDGREVAVKRLYEHNYRRVEQFMNEIEILTRLRHKNLVSLYGCTSRHSQGLLLVYEFVPNGTVADHLHGGGAKSRLLSWPVRMNIAVETASALAYLHASDIIHRDVKTNNILLDNNFGVKVADFGLSRLFPTDVTHISTAPQGTPGYVDPEYHQCYQLTDKSDVYSFGVVLVELISSMPAVDITRHRHEINLANLAINKIQKREFDEMIDPCLRYDSDEEVKRMTISVAELAFLCLQQNKEMRPSMDVVLEELKRIQNGEPKYDNQNEKQDDIDNLKSKQSPPSPHCDEVSLLKNIRLPSSPISVAEKWISHNSTPNVSS